MLRGTAGNELTEIEHRDMVGNVHHHAHVVLDQQDGHAALFLQVKNEARHVLCFLAVHPSDGLIKHQNFGAHGQGAGQFNPFLQAIRQRSHALVADVVDL